MIIKQKEKKKNEKKEFTYEKFNELKDISDFKANKIEKILQNEIKEYKINKNKEFKIEKKGINTEEIIKKNRCK